MNYQKDIHEKLLNDGFKVTEEHEYSTFYKKGVIEIFVYDDKKIVDCMIEENFTDISHLNYTELKKFESLINKWKL